MKILTKLNSVLLLLAIVVSSQSANSGTLTAGHFQIEPRVTILDSVENVSQLGGLTPISEGNNLIQLLVQPVNLAVAGNLYLDFSVFSASNSFAPAGVISLNADKVFIYSASRTPVIEDLSSIAIFDSVPTEFGFIGDALFYTDFPVLDGNFTATENIYIGNYSEMALNAVPVPAAIWFFVSGLSFLGWQKMKI